MIIDSHCHLDFKVFDSDREQVIERARQVGVNQIIIPGVMQNTWSDIKLCCESYPHLYPCYGLHPYFIDRHKESDLDKLRHYIENNKPIAIGECGLDFYLKNLDPGKQLFYFKQQLDIALEFELPVVIHARKSTEAVINAIKKRPGLSGMIHSYSGSYEQATKLIDLGFYLSFGGPITYEKSSRLRSVVKALPLNSLLVETDSPDQPMSNASSPRNEPSFITEVIKNIAHLHNTTEQEVARITTENAKKLFQLV
jgi:TatD DNase family protein